MNKIYIGKITGCHGIKGELKVLSNFEHKDKVFKKGFKLYIDDVPYSITSHRVHKNFNLITIDNHLDINEVNHLINEKVYINEVDLNLEADEYLLEDLYGCAVMDKDENIGIVTDVLLGNPDNFIKVNDSFLIPLSKIFINKIDKENKIIHTNNGKNLKID